MISNTDDTIDSRDVIARIAELKNTQEELSSAIREARDDKEEEEAKNVYEDWQGSDEYTELEHLRALQKQAEDSPDWTHGETLINELYFTDYIEELINDCYDLPKELNSGNWPWRHLTIDYEAAANEAKTDYMEVDFDGVTFLIRA